MAGEGNVLLSFGLLLCRNKQAAAKKAQQEYERHTSARPGCQACSFMEMSSFNAHYSGEFLHFVDVTLSRFNDYAIQACVSQ